MTKATVQIYKVAGDYYIVYICGETRLCSKKLRRLEDAQRLMRAYGRVANVTVLEEVIETEELP